MQAYLTDLIERTMHHENIQVLTRSVIVDHSGMPGLFKTGLQAGPQMFYRQITHGVTILATGALPNRPQEYLLDEHEAVVTQLDLDRFIEEAARKGERLAECRHDPVRRLPVSGKSQLLAHLLPVGRQERAATAGSESRKSRSHVLYRDMRTYGFQEDYYRKARRAGCVFSSVMSEDGKASSCRPTADKVTVTLQGSGSWEKDDLCIAADCLALSTGLIADEEGTEDLAMIFRLPRTRDGYFLEDHVKLRPVDLPVPGFFVAGTAHAPKTIRESIAQAQAAAGRAQTLLGQKRDQSWGRRGAGGRQEVRRMSHLRPGLSL